MENKYPLITVLGPTAVGKTSFAVALASELSTQIISADSRQVYRGMNIGTGKDLNEYFSNGKPVKYHLIDIANPGDEYNVYRFTSDFSYVYNDLILKKIIPLLCGGTGLYLDAILRQSNYSMVEVPENQILRGQLSGETDLALASELAGLRKLHNTTDIVDRNRLIRAIEIELFKQNEQIKHQNISLYPSPVLGLRYSREIIRQRITERLEYRLQNGMVEEVLRLLESGITAEKLIFYGLEYKYVTNFIEGKLSYNQMFTLLNTAIHQFAKRQMTWFRRMEKNGINILWLDGENGINSNIDKALDYLKRYTL